MFEMSDYSKRLYSSFYGRFFHRLRLMKLIKLCHTLNGREVLEIGCRDLLFYYLLDDGGYEKYVGIEIDREDGINFAKRNKKKFGWHNVEIVEAMAESLPFRDESFDLVLCFETIEHVSDEEAAACEIARVLKSSGVLLISLPIEFGPMLLLKVLMRLILKGKKEYNPSSILELIEASILCNPGKIERYEHRGYDYRKTIGYLRAHNISVQKIYKQPFSWLPDSLNMGVIVMLKKGQDNIA